MKPHFKIDDPNKYTEMFKLIDADRPVEVYKNLHKGCWSVRQDGIVRFHTDYITLKLAQFRVGQKGRERVIREKVKNVHAFVKGFLCPPKEIDGVLGEDQKWDTVSYNPYKGNSFFNRTNERKVFSCDFVDMYTNGTNQVIITNV